MQFWKNQEATIWVRINLGSKVNAMTLAYAKNLGFWIWKIDLKAWKIDGSSLNMFEIVIADF